MDKNMPLRYARSAEATLLPGGREDSKIEGVSGVILAGGESRRMGSDKSLLPLNGALFIEHVYRLMAELFEEVILVTNAPDLYQRIPCRKVPDLYRVKSSLAGIHSGLSHARNAKAFVVACDMPFLSAAVIRRLCNWTADADLLLPRNAHGIEPLHALYSKTCLPAIEKLLEAGRLKISLFFPEIHLVEVAAESLMDLDPEGLSFRNINTPREYFALRDRLKVPLAAGSVDAPPRPQADREADDSMNPVSTESETMNIPAISFVAKSGTGKTTLLEKVIVELKGAGYRVGVIKHDAHKFDIDHPGKDSHRLTAAGADTMLISSSSKLAVVKKHQASPPIEELIATYFDDVDLVLTEGFKQSGLPKIELHRKERRVPLLCRGEWQDPSLLAVASDEPLDIDVPVLDLNNPAEIADFTLQALGLRSPQSVAL